MVWLSVVSACIQPLPDRPPPPNPTSAPTPACAADARLSAEDGDGDGISPCDGDCDDNDAAVGAPTLWFPDADGDGFGDATADGQARCDRMPDEQPDATDCDDGAVVVFPGAPESCGDDIDRDCDGIAPDCALQGHTRAASAGLSWAGEAGEGARLSVAGSVFGDGAAIGVGTGVGETPVGARGWVLGSVGGALRTVELTFPTAGRRSIVSGAPDLAGSDAPDLFAAALCEYGDTCAFGGTLGEAWILPGPLPDQASPIEIDSVAGARRVVAPPDACPGIDAVTAGDQLAVSGCGSYDYGVVWLIDRGDGTSDVDLSASPFLLGEELPPYDNGLGSTLASGDVDGDGRADLVLGSFGTLYGYEWSMDAVVVSDIGAHTGIAYATDLGRRFSSFRDPWEWTSGAEVVVADTDGDGTEDVLVGTSGETRTWKDDWYGVIWRLPPIGAPDWSAAAIDRLDGVDGLGRYSDVDIDHTFASALASAGDFDRDGTDDLIVGDHQGGYPERGRAWVISGGDLEGQIEITDLTPIALIGKQTDERFGRFGVDVAAADLDGDGWVDLAVGHDGDLSDSHTIASVFLGGTAPP